MTIEQVLQCKKMLSLMGREKCSRTYCLKLPFGSLEGFKGDLSKAIMVSSFVINCDCNVNCLVLEQTAFVRMCFWVPAGRDERAKN